MSSQRRIVFVSLAVVGLIGLVASLVVYLGSRPDKEIAEKSEQTPRTKRSSIFVDPAEVLGETGIGLASQYNLPVNDPLSLTELKKSISGRGERGLQDLQARYRNLRISSTSDKEDQKQAFEMQRQIGILQVYMGEMQQAESAYKKALELARAADLDQAQQLKIIAALGLVNLRRGEQENCIECLGASSCIFPIVPEAAHKNQTGSRNAIKYFDEYLAKLPTDYRIKWLLNIAYMTLGEYPQHVPKEHLIAMDPQESSTNVAAFQNIALATGLTKRGPNLAGGSLFDDFTGDGLADVFSTSLDAERGAVLLVNGGNGQFVDRSTEAHLDEQIYALNCSHADYDNDGDLDVLLLRGAWEKALRLSLLRNDGHGVFEDVTVRAGLTEPINSEGAAWGDFNRDGNIDLFICGEARGPTGNPNEGGRSCRLYLNHGNGKFSDVTVQAGIVNQECSKGCAWGDYDNDGWIDLFVSNMTAPCQLFHNQGDGTFKDVATRMGVTGPKQSFACWFWDFDNDGLLDLYVNGFEVNLSQIAQGMAGKPQPHVGHPFIYKNTGTGFKEVSRELGLDFPLISMGCNFADVNNDGFLDIYLGTGGMYLEYLVPNLLFLNDQGRKFVDATIPSRTGHLQKGHGISFADWNQDGDLDIFVEAGGAAEGDSSYNVLFDNPGNDQHWLQLTLIGNKSNRAAIGARVQAMVSDSTGHDRSIYRTVGNNSSFGGNSLVVSLGLGSAEIVKSLRITWPSSGHTQEFQHVEINRRLQVTEENPSIIDLPLNQIAGLSIDSADGKN